MATTSMKLSISDTRIPAAIAPPGFIIYRLSPLSLSTNIRSRPYSAAYDNIASPSCLNFCGSPQYYKHYKTPYGLIEKCGHVVGVGAGLAVEGMVALYIHRKGNHISSPLLMGRPKAS